MVSIIECSSILVTKNFQVFMKSTRKLKKKLYLDIMLNFSLLYFPAKVQTTIHQSEKDVPEKKSLLLLWSKRENCHVVLQPHPTCLIYYSFLAGLSINYTPIHWAIINVHTKDKITYKLHYFMIFG